MYWINTCAVTSPNSNNKYLLLLIKQYGLIFLKSKWWANSKSCQNFCSVYYITFKSIQFVTCKYDCVNCESTIIQKFNIFLLCILRKKNCNLRTCCKCYTECDSVIIGLRMEKGKSATWICVLIRVSIMLRTSFNRNPDTSRRLMSNADFYVQGRAEITTDEHGINIQRSSKK